MPRKTAVADLPAVPLDPDLPDVTVLIGEKNYNLRFDFAALGIAQRRLNEAGIRVNMLVAMDIRRLDAERLPFLFFAALVRRQPEITFEEASALITMQNFPRIYDAVVEAYIAACVPKAKGEKKAADPIGEAEAAPG